MPYRIAYRSPQLEPGNSGLRWGKAFVYTSLYRPSIPPLATAFLMIPKLAARIAAIDDKDRGEVGQHEYCDVECYVHTLRPLVPLASLMAIFSEITASISIP